MLVMALALTGLGSPGSLVYPDVGSILTIAAIFMIMSAACLFDRSSRLYQSEEKKGVLLDPTRKASALKKRTMKQSARDRWRSSRWAKLFSKEQEPVLPHALSDTALRLQSADSV
eukprot:3656607-Amphidinium_carterae.1